MNRFFNFLILFFFSNFIFSQSDIIYSETINKGLRTAVNLEDNTLNFVGKNHQFAFVHCDFKHDFYKYDIINNLVYINEVEDLKKTEVKDYKTILWNNNIYRYSIGIDKKTKTYKAFLEKIETLNLTKETTITIKDISIEKFKKTDAQAEITISPDSSKILFSYVVCKEKKTVFDKENTVLASGIIVLNEKLETINQYQNFYKFSEAEQKITLPNYAIDNYGNAYVSFIDNIETTDETRENRKIIILKISNDKVNRVVLKLPKGKYILNSCIGVNKNNEVYCSGIFTKNMFKNMLGVFSAQINFETENMEAKTTDYDLDFLKKHLPENYIKQLVSDYEKGNDFEKYSYKLGKLHFLSDGSPVLDIVKSHVDIVTYYDKTGAHKEYFYNYGDIIISNFQKDGTLKILSKIPREINLTNLGAFTTHSIFINTNDKIDIYYGIYSNKSYIEYFKQFNDAKLLKFSINVNGEETWTEIYDSKKTAIAIRPEVLIEKDRVIGLAVLGVEMFQYRCQFLQIKNK